jgi:hypothetical protein
MRIRYMATILMLLLTTTASAQRAERESALGTSLRDYGGFVGLDTRFGDMNNDFAMFTGGHAAILLKHRIYFGMGGAALTTGSRIGSVRDNLDMAYGGFLLGYILPMPGLVQLTADALMGAGGVKIGEAVGNDELDDAFFAFEPTLGVELKIAPVVRIGFGAAYRYVGGLDTVGLRDNEVRDLTVSARLRAGWF